MAARVKLDQLTQEHKKKIRKDLYLQPVQAGFFKHSRFTGTKDPILFYTVDKPNEEIVLPYTYGNSLMGYHINSKRQYPGGKFNFNKDIKWRDHQIPIINGGMSYLQTKGTFIMGAFPGAGKTLMSSWMASSLGGLVLVIIPSLTMVLKGWDCTFKEYTDAKVWVNNGKNPMPEECNVILTMDTMFHKIDSKVLMMVHTLIIDEAHKFCSPGRINCLLASCPKYIIACTATLERSDGMHSIIHRLCGTHGIFIKSQKPFKVYKLETGIKKELEKTKQGNTDWPKLVRDLSFDKNRNSLIFNILSSNPQHKILVLTWNVQHAYYLHKVLKEKEKCDVLAGSKSDYFDSRILIGTMGKCNCGFDEATSCIDWGGIRLNMILLVGSTKSISTLDQTIGRVFRSDDPIVIDFVDADRISKNQWRQRLKLYEDPERNGEVVYLSKIKDENNKDEENEKLHMKQLMKHQLKNK